MLNRKDKADLIVILVAVAIVLAIFWYFSGNKDVKTLIGLTA